MWRGTWRSTRHVTRLIPFTCQQEIKTTAGLRRPRRNSRPSRLGHTISSAYIVNFHTHLFSVLPATFPGGFKKLLAATLAFFTEGAAPNIPASVQDSKLWPSFEILGLADRYESLIASVCYEHIEAHVLETCT